MRTTLAAVVAGALLLVGCGDDRPVVATATTTTSTTLPTTAPAGSGEVTVPAATDVPEALTVEVLGSAPHDTDAFTEGLMFDADGDLYESVGLEGKSSVRRVDPATGDVELERELEDDQFGEGLAFGQGRFVQLTWKTGVARTWSADDLGAGADLTFSGEGWGLTFDGVSFLQSDGSPTITARDAATFAPVGSYTVTREGRPVEELNELEWVDGALYANVWHSDEIMRIDPTTGAVTGVIDAAQLWQDPDRTSEMTLNGIAHQPGDPPDVLYLTGKNWPELFQVRVVPA